MNFYMSLTKIFALLFASVLAFNNQDQLADHLLQTCSELHAQCQRNHHPHLTCQEALSTCQGAVKVMRGVDRKKYSGTCQYPYSDAACQFGIGKQTISQPYMHLYALRVVYNHIFNKNVRILDIGCGSGYLTATFYKAAGPGSLIVGIDNNREIVNFAKANLIRDLGGLLSSPDKTIILDVYNGYNGYPDQGLYDVIHIGAATPTSIIEKLKSQLKETGIIVAPNTKEVETVMYVYQKGRNSEIETLQNNMPVRYVPLTDRIVP